jgi:hypothetical protein
MKEVDGTSEKRLVLPTWLETQLDTFPDGKKPYIDSYVNEAELDALLAHLDVTTIEGGDILGYHFENTMGGSRTVDTDDMLRTGFGGAGTMHTKDIFDILADTQNPMTTDFENDFRATVAIRKNDTAIIVGQRCEEIAQHCEACAGRMGETDEEGIYIEESFSCSHMDSKYDYARQYWFGLMKLNEFEDRPDWKVWEIDGLATMPRIEQKVGVEEGRIALWELEVGDRLHVTAEDQKETYIYDLSIVSAGIEPTVTIRQTNPDGSIVDGGDMEVVLRGTGVWVGREWPLFKGDYMRDKQILIDYGNMHVDGEIVLLDPTKKPGDNQATLKPAVSSIKLIRSKRTWNFPKESNP